MAVFIYSIHIKIQLLFLQVKLQLIEIGLDFLHLIKRLAELIQRVFIENIGG